MSDLLGIKPVLSIIDMWLKRFADISELPANIMKTWERPASFLQKLLQTIYGLLLSINPGEKVSKKEKNWKF